jgi:hypothetical protein
MDFVTIKHTDPAILDALVPASSVDHWRTLGWLTEAEHADWLAAQDAPADPVPPADPADPPVSKPAARGRRSTGEKD